MMQNYGHGQLLGSEIHGFYTLQDLDIGNIIEEASSRWLRPNEIHAILCNYKYFTINVKPMNLPQSGRIILFDRKMLRNFRKDGHNWKKKKDGKTVKEAHEHLKVGNEERIHVYYAHGQDNPTFVRRCYWLLDKAYEHIVLVHYRETQESQSSPSRATPGNSNSSSLSDTHAPRVLSEEYDSGSNQKHYFTNQASPNNIVPGDSLTIINHEMKLHELNTLDWDELVTDNNATHYAPSGGGGISFPEQQIAEVDVVGNMGGMNASGSSMHNQVELLDSGGLQSQDSFGRWINCIMTDSPGSMNDPLLKSSLTMSQYSSASPPMNSHQSSGPEQIFSITEVSPGWAFSKEKTKILVTGFFHEGYAHLAKSNILCITGDICVPAEIVQIGVYRCYISPHSPGLVNFFLSFDGHKPISQVINFEFRDPPIQNPQTTDETKPEQEDLHAVMRLAHLLFTTSKSFDIASSKVSPSSIKEGRKFAFKTSNLMKSWEYLMRAVKADKASFPQTKENILELTLKSRLREWLLERVIGGYQSSELDANGQGVIHLCAILGFTWSVQLFSWSSLSLDFRDRSGWTALHWAAYYGREKMVASLLSAGAKPNLVTDPTSENPGGCTAADLASKAGHEGLAAYLAEKGLVQHFKDMSIAGNISGSLPNAEDTSTITNENLTEDDVCLKDTLAAYRTAADAAARIQSAFREHSMKVRVQQVEFSNPEDEARSIIAAMRIQHAFRNYDTKKQMVAAARIQHRFRTWKLRREFLNMRRQAIKIQAVFRGFQVRRQYRKIIWSVGVLEKAILRWRLKRKGFRGLQVEPAENVLTEPKEDSDTEEDFFRISRRQAEERVERAVVRVQAMFRSKKAQEEYRRMKLACKEAETEYEEEHELDSEMEG